MLILKLTHIAVFPLPQKYFHKKQG